ncbi:MAG: insulinase family protein [Bacteroidales bacterium]|nr:insulinase family protein [Bacteroidales bacterium]
MRKINIKSILLIALVILATTLNAQNFKKKTYKNDPMNVIHYTLNNGLEVFLSVNKDVPRIQTYIAVRVGSKNDPAESTGLSHYLEHLMFKGTTSFGTLDWNKEQKYIKEIEKLYEVYNHTTDQNKRTEIYHQIDSVSYLASQYAIPNEYDKMMSLMGAEGTNAFTSNDMTVYQENIPSNELERWLKVEGDRFADPVFRLFHTELEAVYEEKNMGMANDGRKVYEALNLALYPTHPYGTQTTIGTIEHLKNPSLDNIKKHFNNYYVPNNYCIALSGDFDPEEAIKLINKYFGKIPAKAVPEFKFEKEKPITEVKKVDVWGLEAENIRIGFRIDAGNGSRDVLLASLMDRILSNGSCGLIDENINQKQLAMYAGSGVSALNDYSAFLLVGMPKQGQTLDEVKDLLLQQIDIFKSGNWDESLLTAAINNIKLDEMKGLESNENRAMSMISAYLAHQDWQDAVNETEEMSKITKQELIDFAKRIFKNNNYVVIYKRQGEPKEVTKVEKPAITPVVMNRDVESKFLTEVKNMKVNEIEPVFVNYDKDMQKTKLKNGTEILYVENKQNGRFQLVFRYDFGYRYSKMASVVNSATDYLESTNRSLAQIKREMYDIACDYNISMGGSEYCNISIEGLTENMEKALAIVEDIINNPQISKEAVENAKLNLLKSRQDSKSRQNTIFQKLVSYANFGQDALKFTATNEEINSLTDGEVLRVFNLMCKQPQTILFYGNKKLKDVAKLIEKSHKISMNKMALNKDSEPDYLPTTDNKVMFVNYDAKQSLCRQLNRADITYSAELEPKVDMYNEYFGGSMNSIVFQEIREKRSLAYSAAAYFISPSSKDKHYLNMSHIGTQNDKLIDALNAFTDLLDNMPVSEQNFEIAKQSLISGYRTSRISKMGIINSYLQDKKMERSADWREKEYKAIMNMNINDVINFNKSYIKGKKRNVVVLGNEKEVDMEGLKVFGNLQKLSLEEIFGY